MPVDVNAPNCAEVSPAPDKYVLALPVTMIPNCVEDRFPVAVADNAFTVVDVSPPICVVDNNCRAVELKVPNCVEVSPAPARYVPKPPPTSEVTCVVDRVPTIVVDKSISVVDVRLVTAVVLNLCRFVAESPFNSVVDSSETAVELSPPRFVVVSAFSCVVDRS